MLRTEQNERKMQAKHICELVGRSIEAKIDLRKQKQQQQNQIKSIVSKHFVVKHRCHIIFGAISHNFVFFFVFDIQIYMHSLYA